MATTPTNPSEPPTRPKDWSEVGFEKEKFVRWFHPVELLRAGLYTLLGGLFGSFADKREMQAALNQPDARRFRQYADAAPGEDFWFDYVADIGDGFDATYSIAYLLAQEELALAGVPEPTRRGRLLLMGGDEVYPTASRKNYLNRSVGPYRAALPWLADEERVPHLYAVPGNHDWYDGLSAFLRQFVQREQRWVGAWRTQQRRSYFARKLPRSYWLWGVDIQLHADIDSPQLDYFCFAAEQLSPNDRIILATAEPSWVKEAEGDHAGYQSLLKLIEVAEARGARVVLVLTGDSHHYAHYVDLVGSGKATHFITAGGGGAFLHGTHTLPPRISLPSSTDPARRDRRHLKWVNAFPTSAESRQLIRTKVGWFPFKNKAFAAVWFFIWLWLGLLLWTGDGCCGQGGSSIVDRLSVTLGGVALESRAFHLAVLGIVFGAVLVVRVLAGPVPEEKAGEGDEESAEERRRRAVAWRTVVDLGLWLLVVYALIVVAVAGAPSPLGVLWESMMRNLSAALLIVLVPVAGALYVSRPFDKLCSTWSLRLLFGFLHGCLYVLTWLLLAVLGAKLSQCLGWGDWVWLLGVPLVAPGVSTLLFAGALWFGGQYQRALLNDAFSAIGVEDYKNFLRLRIDPEGELTIFAIGLRRVVRDWGFFPKGESSKPFIVPKPPATLDPHLIERIDIPAG
jgi:hypothetical protein